MSVKQRDEQHKEERHAEGEKSERQQRNVRIGQHVMRGLGQPGNLQLVQVRQLWEDRYRVNILVGVDAASVKVAHSFFLETDGDGNVVASTPRITRQY